MPNTALGKRAPIPNIRHPKILIR